MSCCGNKRKAWATETRLSGGQQSIPAGNAKPVTERPDRVFEYTGNNTLTLRGAISGKQYHFRFNGDKQTIDFMDSFAVMAERDLRVLVASSR